MDIPYGDIAPMMELLFTAVPVNASQSQALDAFWALYPNLHPLSPTFGIEPAPKPVIPPMGENSNGEDDEHPLWCINTQITELLGGYGASEDHEAVVTFLRETGLPMSTVRRMHRALSGAETKPQVVNA